MAKSRFCTECGTQFLEDALFCHICGAPADGRTSQAPAVATSSTRLRWGVPGAALLLLIGITAYRAGTSASPAATAEAPSLAPGSMRAPDISSMSPAERADRLFNRVMQYWSVGNADSAAFFAPMALAAFDALGPLNIHSRYDLGLVSLVARDVGRASAQADTILAANSSHLLGLILAARVADARGDAGAAQTLRQRLLSAEVSERASGLPEYASHDADIRGAVALARGR